MDPWPPPWPTPGSELADQFEQTLGITIPRARGPVPAAPRSAPVPLEHTTQPVLQPTMPPPAPAGTAPGTSSLTSTVTGRPSPISRRGAAPPPSREWPLTLAARHCPSGHPNPPTATACRACAAPITDPEVRVIDRPVLGELHLGDGTVVAFDAPLLLGRNPAEDHTVFGLPARPIRLPDPFGKLSRSHLEIRAVQWQVQVVDRRSTNGTSLRAPDGAIVPLAPGVPFELEPGATVILGATVACEFRAVSSVS